MGNTLKEVRESKGITQKFVASQLGISRQQYHTIENHPNYVPKITHPPGQPGGRDHRKPHRRSDVQLLLLGRRSRSGAEARDHRPRRQHLVRHCRYHFRPLQSLRRL